MYGLSIHVAMNKTLLLAIFVVVVVALGVTAAAVYRYKSTGSKPTNSSYYPVTLKDASGRNITLYAQPTRIVSLAPSDTQILVSLGLGKELVGVDYYSYLLLKYLNDTSELPQNVTVFSPSLSPNISGIVALRPNIVIDELGLIGDYSAQLSEAGLTTFYTNDDYAGNYTAIEGSIALLGKLFDRNTQAMELINWMNSRIQTYESRGYTSVAYLLWINPDHTFYTAGSNTFINTILNLSGGVNVFSNSTGYPVLSPESLVLEDPQVIIAQELTNLSYTLYMINTTLGISNVSAYANHRVYVMSENLPTFLLDEPGPLSVYAIQMINLAIKGDAPSYISSAWVESELNVTLPVF
jgi:ABC-type Fe3+-hydroxamate transport system, periplasmic component